MQYIEYKNLTSIHQQSLNSLSLGRLLICIITGASVTFGLFVIMQALIKQDDISFVKSEPFLLVSSILDIPEQRIITRTVLKPLPELKTTPQTPTELPQTSSKEANFSTAVNIPAIANDKLVFDIAALDQQPRPLVRVDPKYPASAAANGIEGFVQLSFSISASGEVIDVNIIDSAPRNTFDHAAKQALRKWRYQPKIENGAARGMEGLQVRLDFALSGS